MVHLLRKMPDVGDVSNAAKLNPNNVTIPAPVVGRFGKRVCVTTGLSYVKESERVPAIVVTVTEPVTL